MRINLWILPFALVLAFITQGSAEAPWPSFDAVALTGQRVESDQLLGQPTLLIVTPSRKAAKDTRQWATALRKEIDLSRYQVRDVLAINLPFFISERDAIEKAREKIPQRHYDKTWLFNSALLERELGIPKDSPEACVVVLNQGGRITAKIHGSLTEKRLEEIVTALQQLDNADG